MSGYIGQAPVVQATQTRQSFTATANQTSFATLGYEKDHLDVFLNGVKLNAADYTATNNSDIVLAAGCAVNDILEMVAFGTFEVANQSFTGTTVINTLTVTNDGAGSNLDADQLDGQHGAYYTGYTDTQLAALVDSSPAALNTLNELAAALGDDANFSTTVTNSIATKLPLAGGTMTGDITRGGTVIQDGTITDTGDFTLDVAGDIILDADAANWRFKDAGTSILEIGAGGGGGGPSLFSAISNADMVFKGNDGGSAITALTLNMENAGAATFNSHVTIGSELRTTNINTASSTGTLVMYGGASNKGGTIELSGGNNTGSTGSGIVFKTGASTSSPAERMRIDSSGNVGIGTSSPRSSAGITTLEISGGTYARHILKATNSGGREYALLSGTSGQFMVYDYTAGSERMRIDSSGRLLVAKTASGAGNVGAEMRTGVNDHAMVATTSGNASPLAVNRQTGGSGPLIQMYIANSHVANLSGDNTRLLVESAGDAAGLRFDASGYTPFKNGTTANGTVDLGFSSGRFKDLYLSGGVYLGGTGAANKLSDYETGSWTPTLVGGITNHSISQAYGHYTKVGDLVYIYGRIQLGGGGTAASGQVIISGLPFSANANAYVAGDFYINSAAGGGQNAKPLVFPSSSRIYMYQQSTTGVGGLSGTTLGVNFDMLFNFTYKT